MLIVINQSKIYPFIPGRMYHSSDIVRSLIDILRALATSEHFTADTTPPVEYEIGTLQLFTAFPSLPDIHTHFSSYCTFLLKSCFPQMEHTPQHLHSQIDRLRTRVCGLIKPNPSLHWKGLCEYTCHLLLDRLDARIALPLSNPAVRVTLFTILTRLKKWLWDLTIQLITNRSNAPADPFAYFYSSYLNIYLAPPYLPSGAPSLPWNRGYEQRRTNRELSEEERNNLKVMKRIAETQFTEADMEEVVLMDRSSDIVVTSIANTHCSIPAHPDF